MVATTITGTITRGSNDIWATTAMALANNNTTVNLNCGQSTKNSILRHGYWIFDTPDLPYNAKILDARMTVQWGGAKIGAAFDQDFYSLEPDGKWNKDSVTGWSELGGWDSRMVFFNDDGPPTEQFATVQIASLTTYIGHQVNKVQNRGDGPQDYACTFLNLSGAFNASSVYFHLRKIGAPDGNLWVELYETVGFGDDGNYLATSNSVAASTLLTDPGSDIEFTFNEPYPAIQNIFAYNVVLRGDSTRSGVNYVGVNMNVANIQAAANSWTYGTGYGFDRQNYNTQQQLDLIPVSATYRRQIAPAYAVGATYEFTNAHEANATGSWNHIVQEAVARGSYKDDHKIGIKWDATHGSATTEWLPAAYDNVTYASAELEITYEPRRVITVV